MKKITLSLITLVVLTIGNANAQKLIKYIDDMNDNVYFMFDKRFSLIDRVKDKGFAVDLYVDTEERNVDGDPKIKGISTKSVNIGTCSEKDELIIMFEDDSKITFIAWNKYNCEGDGYYELTKHGLEQLRTKKVKKVRLTNGRSFDSLTMDVEPEKQDYFIKAINSVETKTFTTQKK